MIYSESSPPGSDQRCDDYISESNRKTSNPIDWLDTSSKEDTSADSFVPRVEPTAYLRFRKMFRYAVKTSFHPTNSQLYRRSHHIATDEPPEGHLQVLIKHTPPRVVCLF